MIDTFNRACRAKSKRRTEPQRSEGIAIALLSLPELTGICDAWLMLRTGGPSSSRITVGVLLALSETVTGFPIGVSSRIVDLDRACHLGRDVIGAENR